jgi:hypothetical protein
MSDTTRRVEESNLQVKTRDRFQDDLPTIGRILRGEEEERERREERREKILFSFFFLLSSFFFLLQCDRRELNPLILVSQTSPATALGSVTVELRGIEPLTFCLQDRYSSN